ncbi:MAG: DNA primase catalytic subunit PriS [Candidatus Thermoplasmatota archaeon]|nr:DNA primase catalytic subunit PriS [Candidatus Thermoplasmatota archaeon]MCL5439312.1 DNA primase catalytic subunit PriS [Candidatus Thermoplasmatota archaeon]
MDSETRMKEIFREYYSNLRYEIPDLLGSREIGFIPFGGTMIRHRSLRGREELGKFLTSIVPRHMYYSLAYYDHPTKRSMQEKGWKGAELIFDLDADHLEGASSMTYEQILDEVKKHTLRLIFTFLIGILGISEDSIKLYFSGGRGYHVHVQDDGIYRLDSNSRREISNLVRGEGVSLSSLLNVHDTFRRDPSGWFSLIDTDIVHLYEGIRKNLPDSIAKLKTILKKEDQVEKYLSSLEKFARMEGNTARKVDIFPTPGIKKYAAMGPKDLEICEWIARETINRTKCEIDEPVTTDVHRLIRFPGSLHGKTGLAVTRIQLHDLEKFNPLDSAIPEAFLDKHDKVKINRPMTITMKGEMHSLSGELEVPRYVALFAVASRAGEFI